MLVLQDFPLESSSRSLGTAESCDAFLKEQTVSPSSICHVTSSVVQEETPAGGEPAPGFPKEKVLRETSSCSGGVGCGRVGCGCGGVGLLEEGLVGPRLPHIANILDRFL